jgi:hypothetical protein
MTRGKRRAPKNYSSHHPPTTTISWSKQAESKPPKKTTGRAKVEELRHTSYKESWKWSCDWNESWRMNLCVVSRSSGEGMVCCQRCQKWNDDSSARCWKKNYGTFVIFFHAKKFVPFIHDVRLRETITRISLVSPKHLHFCASASYVSCYVTSKLFYHYP